MIGDRKYSGYQVVTSITVEVHRGYREESGTFRTIFNPDMPIVVKVEASNDIGNRAEIERKATMDQIGTVIKEAVLNAYAVINLG